MNIINVVCIFCSLFSCDNDEVLLLIHKFCSSLRAQFLVRVAIYMSLVNLAGLGLFNPCFITSQIPLSIINTLVLQFTFGAMKSKDL